jgi:hypothetical protein
MAFMLEKAEMAQPLDLGIVDRVLARRLGVGKRLPGAKSTWMVSRRCPASKSAACTNQGTVMPRAAASAEAPKKRL